MYVELWDLLGKFARNNQLVKNNNFVTNTATNPFCSKQENTQPLIEQKKCQQIIHK